jgi:hypothetical protein
MPTKKKTPTLYKATRPNGRAFHDANFDYAEALTEGLTVKHPRPHKRDATGYLSVSDSPMDLPGAGWPLRLFEVEIVGDSWMPGDYPHKHAGHEVRVLREVDAHLVFGPEGKHIAPIVEKYWQMDDDDHDAMRALRGDYYEFRDAWLRVRSAACSLGVGSAPAGFGLGLDDDCWITSLCGALALLVRGLDPSKISEADYATLSKPWREYVGPVHPDDTLPAKGQPAK